MTGILLYDWDMLGYDWDIAFVQGCMLGDERDIVSWGYHIQYGH